MLAHGAITPEMVGLKGLGEGDCGGNGWVSVSKNLKVGRLTSAITMYLSVRDNLPHTLVP